MLKNRIAHSQTDYLFLIIRKPRGWQPSSIADVPSGGEVLSEHFVASYAEAHEDLVRCNELAMSRDLHRWAVIQAPCGGL